MSAVGDLFATVPAPPAAPRAPKTAEGGPFVHLCAVCGSDRAPFGHGVKLRAGVFGTWYCAAHQPEAGR